MVCIGAKDALLRKFQVCCLTKLLQMLSSNADFKAEPTFLHSLDPLQPFRFKKTNPFFQGYLLNLYTCIDLSRMRIVMMGWTHPYPYPKDTFQIAVAHPLSGAIWPSSLRTDGTAAVFRERH
jgi:hypothetical protein